MLTTQCGNGQDIFFDSTFTLELGLIEKRPARKTVDIFTLYKIFHKVVVVFTTNSTKWNVVPWPTLSHLRLHRDAHLYYH